MLGSDRQRLANSYGKVNGTRVRERERENSTESKANGCSTIPPPLGGARAGLFIGEVKVLITLH
jgi:hypothetical protein